MSMFSDKDELAKDLAADAASAIIPYFGQTLGKRLIAPVVREWQRNMSAALRAAETEADMSREDIVELMQNDPRTVPLYMRILMAAGMNGHDRTMRALGAAFGKAARASVGHDDDGLEDAELALRAISDLVPRHFRVLFVLAESEVIFSENASPSYSQYSAKYVSEQAAMPVEVANQCLLNLAAAGLVTTIAVWGDGEPGDSTAYPLTDIGKAVIRAAQAVSDTSG